MRFLVAGRIALPLAVNSLRDSTAEGLIARYPKTFAKYPKNKIKIIDIYIVGNKAKNSQGCLLSALTIVT